MGTLGNFEERKIQNTGCVFRQETSCNLPLGVLGSACDEKKLVETDMTRIQRLLPSYGSYTVAIMASEVRHERTRERALVSFRVNSRNSPIAGYKIARYV